MEDGHEDPLLHRRVTLGVTACPRCGGDAFFAVAYREGVRSAELSCWTCEPPRACEVEEAKR